MEGRKKERKSVLRVATNQASKEMVTPPGTFFKPQESESNQHKPPAFRQTVILPKGVSQTFFI